MLTMNPPAIAPRLQHDAWGRLVLTDDVGRDHVGVSIVRCFPISEPRRGLALCDEHGRELLWIDDLDRCMPALRQALEAELAQREFIPVLERIERVSSNVEPSEWHVVTDRGPTAFLLGSEENVRRLSQQAALIVDTNGIRYLIPDLAALDTNSRRLLERFIA